MAKRGYKFQEFVAHATDVNCLNIGKKSCRVFVTGGSDRVVSLWQFGSSNSLLSLSGHTTSIQSVTFDSAEVLVLAGASNGTIKLWDLEEGKSVRTVTGHRSSCSSVEFHPFGEFFASGSMDTDLKIWDIRKKGSIHTYKGHTRGIRTIKFTPDGRWVVTGGEDNIVKIWDLTAGRLLHDFKFHKGMIRCIDFHPHEFLLATGSVDRTVKFWDLETFELIGSSGAEATGIRSMVFHPDGKTLFCALDEVLKVLSWEPIRCHDAVEMGWSSLADLIIYEGKLWGCSYHQSHVGVWIADISLIRPYATGLGSHTNSLTEHMPSYKENSFIGLVRSDSKSNSLLATAPVGYAVKKTEGEIGGLSISSMECSQSLSWETDSIHSASISSTSNGPKVKTSASSQLTPKKKDSDFSQSTFNSTKFRVAKLAETSARIPKKTMSNCYSRDSSPSTKTLYPNTSSGAVMELHTVKNQEFSIPVIVPRNHLSHETTSSTRVANSSADSLACDVSGSPSHVSRSSDCDSDGQSHGAEIGPSNGVICNKFHGNHGSKSRYMGTAETLAAGGDHCTSIRDVAENFERIVLPEQSATAKNDKNISCADEESASSSNGNCSVKYVRGVAIQLGKTRSLVERFERSGSFSHSAEKGTFLGSGREITLEDYNSIWDHLLQSHDVFINSLKSRLTKLQVVRHFWEFNGIKAAVDAAIKLPDHSVQIDLVSVLGCKLDLFNLDIFLCLLPLLLGLVNSKTERHVAISLEILCKLVKIFGAVISSTVSAASFVGVDLEAEERLQRSKQCHKYLERIKQILPSVIRGGSAAKHAEELSKMLLQTSS